jgi:hypothetical protein
MMFTRFLVGLAASLIVLANPGCSPTDPQSRLEAALATLQSDASSSRKEKACTAILAALAEYPRDAADRPHLTERAAASSSARCAIDLPSRG